MPGGIENVREVIHHALGEHAARLGSPDTFDRKGNVFWMDDFENGIHRWAHSGVGGGSNVWDAAAARTGSFSCKLTTGTTEDNYRSMDTILKYSELVSRYGLEFSIACSGQTIKSITVSLPLNDGGYSHQAALKWVSLSPLPTLYGMEGKWQYHGEDGVYHDVGLDQYIWQSLVNFCTTKFVVDYSKGEYVRLITDVYTVDLSGLKYYKVNYLSSKSISPDITIATWGDGSASIANIDDVIFTGNEPANPVV